MAFINITSGTYTPNFLESAVGLVLKTRTIPQSLGTTEGKYTTVAAGTAFPADDSTATGIVYQGVDVTDGDNVGSVLVAGRVLKNRLSLSDEAVAALEALGIVFVDAPEVER